MPISQIKRAVEGTVEAFTRPLSRYNFIDQMKNSITNVQKAVINSAKKEETANDEQVVAVAEGVLSSPSVKGKHFSQNKDTLLFLKDRADNTLGPIYEYRHSLTQKQTLQSEQQVDHDDTKVERPGTPSPGKKF